MSLFAAFSGDEVWFLVSFYTHFSPNQTKIKLKVKESRNLLWCLAGQNGNLTETTNGGKFHVKYWLNFLRIQYLKLCDLKPVLKFMAQLL